MDPSGLLFDQNHLSKRAFTKKLQVLKIIHCLKNIQVDLEEFKEQHQQLQK